METREINLQNIDNTLDSIKGFIKYVKETSGDLITVRSLHDNFTNIRETRRKLFKIIK